MDLLSLIKEVHSLWCCSKVMWKLSICSINLAQLEVISSYKGGMDRTQDTSISLMYRGTCMRLAHGIFCWKWNLSFFASPPCEEGRTEREDEGRSIYSRRGNLKQYWRREFGGNCLNFLFVKVWGCVFISSLPTSFRLQRGICKRWRFRSELQDHFPCSLRVTKLFWSGLTASPYFSFCLTSLTSVRHLSQPPDS